MKLKLRNGDKCFIRIHSGEILEATYDDRVFTTLHHKEHFVIANGLYYMTTKYIGGFGQCRFVYPPKEALHQHLAGLSNDSFP